MSVDFVTPSTWKSTFDIPTLSVADAAMLTVPDTVDPEPGLVTLSAGDSTRLYVDDSGAGVAQGSGFGLELVRRMVEQGLDGRFELHPLASGGTRAEVVFPSAAR